MQLGGRRNLLDPLPGKPRLMHRRAYGRLRDAAIAAEERMLDLDLHWLRTRYEVTLCLP